MTRRFFGTVILAAFVATSWPAFAHEGHAHKIMGTVSVIHENHLEVKDAKEKTSTITLNEKTKILRGTTAMKVTDITVGARVVVTATQTKGEDGKVTLVANEVRLGAAPATAKK